MEITLIEAMKLYPPCDWRYEVRNEDTILGYYEWLDHKVESDELLLEGDGNE